METNTTISLTYLANNQSYNGNFSITGMPMKARVRSFRSSSYLTTDPCKMIPIIKGETVSTVVAVHRPANAFDRTNHDIQRLEDRGWWHLSISHNYLFRQAGIRHYTIDHDSPGNRYRIPAPSPEWLIRHKPA